MVEVCRKDVSPIYCAQILLQDRVNFLLERLAHYTSVQLQKFESLRIGFSFYLRANVNKNRTKSNFFGMARKRNFVRSFHMASP